MTPSEQLELWIKGQNVHNHEKFYNVVDDNAVVVKRVKQEGGECCPDFSCCNPESAWDQETRTAFYRAFKESDEATIQQMLMMALGSLSSQNSESKIYVAGLHGETYVAPN